MAVAEFTGTLRIESNDPASPRDIALAARASSFAAPVSFVSYEGEATIYGITEFGELSDPPRKYLILAMNQGALRRDDAALNPTHYEDKLINRVNYDDAGTKLDGLDLLIGGGDTARNNNSPGLGTRAGDTSNPLDSYEDRTLAQIGDWSSFLPTWIRSKREKYFSAFTEGPSEIDPLLMFGMSTGSTGVNGTSRGLAITQPVWTGSKWQITVYVGGDGKSGIGSVTGVEAYGRFAVGNQDPGETDNSDQFLLQSPVVPANLGDSFLSITMEIPPNVSARFGFRRVGLGGDFDQFPQQIDTLYANGSASSSGLSEPVRNDWIYFPEGPSTLQDWKYAEELHIEDSPTTELESTGVAVEGEEWAETVSVTGGITAESHDPIVFTGKTVKGIFTLPNLTPGRAYTVRLTFEQQPLPSGTSSFVTEEITVEPGLSTEKLVEVRVIAPEGFRRRLAGTRITSSVPVIEIELPEPGTPIITSALTYALAFGASASYQITTLNVPTSYGAVGLPAGLSIDSGTGLITGTISEGAGTYPVTISASNAFGTGTAELVITQNAAPIIPQSAFDAADLAAAYGLRRLVDGYAGNLFRLRRTSDNAEQNFAVGYTIEQVFAFLDGSQGRFVTLFDQSGNGLDKTQSSAALQPIFTLDAPGGYPAVQTTAAANYYMETAATLTARQIVAACRIDAGADNGAAIVCNKANESTELRKVFSSADQYDAFNFPNSSILVNEVATAAYTPGSWHIGRFVGGSDKTFENAHVIYVSSASSLGRAFNGRFMDLLFYTAAGAANAPGDAADLITLWGT